MYMEHIKATSIPGSKSKSRTTIIVGLVVAIFFVPYIVIRIAFSGIHMFAYTVAEGLLAVGENALREMRKLS